MSTIVTIAALLIVLGILGANASKGINPVQHSERTPASQASKGINPVQHSE
jgi:hypothetical protein